MQQLFYLNKFLWKYRFTLLLGAFFVLVSNIFALYPAEFVRISLDSILENLQSKTENSDIHYILLKYGGLIILFAICKGIFMYFMRQTIIVMSRKIEFDLKNEIYNKYQELSMSFFKLNTTGDLMNRITEDVSRVRMYVGPAVMYTINITILFLLVIGKMLSISVTLTTYVLIPLPFLAISVYHISKKINEKSEMVQSQLSKLTAFTQEKYSGIKLIKSFTNEEVINKSFMNYCKEYTKRQLALTKIDAMFFPLVITLVGLSTVLTVYIGGIESYNKQSGITAGNIAEFIIYVNMLAWPVASIGWITSLIQKAEASQERINEFLKTKSEITNQTKADTKIEGDIHFQNVSLIYQDTGIVALKDINLKIQEGSKLGIFGETGSGKSSLVSLLSRIYNPSKGRISFGEDDIKILNLKNLRSSISYVPQDGYLFSDNIEMNISFSDNNINYEKLNNSSKNAEIFEEIMSFPEKFNTLIGERGVQLSGGQRQRLAIARALYHNSKILILDDCMSAVDANTEKLILDNIINIAKDKTVFLISNRISSLMMCDEIIVLNKGSIIEAGNHKMLLKKNGFYRKSFDIQRNNKTDII